MSGFTADERRRAPMFKPAMEYDESCSVSACECCETWRVLLADVRREAAVQPQPETENKP